GTNVIPLQMSRQTLRDGYVQVYKDLYEPEAYFDRLAALHQQKPPFFSAMRNYNRQYRWRRLNTTIKHLGLVAILFIRLMWHVPEVSLRRAYARWLLLLLRERPDPYVLLISTFKCAMHYHHYRLAIDMIDRQSALVNSF